MDTQPDHTSLPAPGTPKRKVFNVIVDASTLISGVKRNTRDGIKKWVNNGAIRLFVPMHSKPLTAPLNCQQC